MFCNDEFCFERVSWQRKCVLTAKMSLCFHAVECHAIHASCTIKGLVTNCTVIFADYAKFSGVLNQLKQIYINQVKRALKISYDCLL